MKPFPWRPGMSAEVHPRGGHVTIFAVSGDFAFCAYMDGPHPSTAQPRIADLRLDLLTPVEKDAATIGALLGVVREVWNAPGAQVTPYVRWTAFGKPEIEEWMVCLNDATDRRCPPNERAESEFAALLAAYQEAP